MTAFSTGSRIVKPPLEHNSSAVRLVSSAVTVLFVAVAAINIGAAFYHLSAFPKTHLSAAALAAYLLIEAKLYLRRSDDFGLLSPAFLALILHFFLSYLAGITGAVFAPEVMLRYGYWISDLDVWLANTMLVAILAAFCMLRGYALARPGAHRLRTVLWRMPQLRREFRFYLSLMLAVQVVYLAMVAYAINLGVYGLLSTQVDLAEHIQFLQLLKLFFAAGQLSYFMILFRYFELIKYGRPSSLLLVIVIALVVLHVLTGALTAFKSQVVVPFVLASLAYFLATRRLPLRYLGLTLIALFVAYSVVEPFRVLIGSRGVPGSALEAIDAIATAAKMREELRNESDLSLAEQIAARFDLAAMTTLAIDYVESDRLPPSLRQRFQNSILLAPILAYVPRVIWSNKPIYAEGVWFNQNVRGSLDETTSVGMGPIGYLYMAGGIVGVALGFLGLGILQAFIFEGAGRAGAGGLIIFISTASVLVTIPSSFGPAIAGVLQMLPVAFMAQLLFLRASPITRTGR